ncbi:MAG: hypothetical protein M1416_03525 [Candidatus Pacearchaeota archaeon]|nr:hypothetical protein [Candidatus Pacearchaeota archaeon]
MKYTISEEADKKIEEDFKVIKEIILEKFNPVAIISFGGFGHGGGSFKKIKGKILPLNDYDLYLITKEQISNQELEELGKKCSERIGRGGIEFVEEFENIYDEKKFFHVDLHCITEKKLSKLYPTQRTFDLKSSLVIYGDEKVLEKIPDVKISKSDSVRMLFNKINHFNLAEKNSKEIRSIYAVKGFTDLCSSLLIFEGKYTSSRYQDKEKIFSKLDVPEELKKFVSEATKAKLYEGYSVANVDYFFAKSKEWVNWGLKRILKGLLNTKEEGWKEICLEAYKKLPYFYFKDYLKYGWLFPAQYYLNIRFFLEGIRKKEFLIKSLMRWRDAGLIIAFAMILYSSGEMKEAEKYLRKLTAKISPLRERILKLYSIYYLQKLV